MYLHSTPCLQRVGVARVARHAILKLGSVSNANKPFSARRLESARHMKKQEDFWNNPISSYEKSTLGALGIWTLFKRASFWGQRSHWPFWYWAQHTGRQTRKQICTQNCMKTVGSCLRALWSLICHNVFQFLFAPFVWSSMCCVMWRVSFHGFVPVPGLCVFHRHDRDLVSDYNEINLSCRCLYSPVTCSVLEHVVSKWRPMSISEQPVSTWRPRFGQALSQSAWWECSEHQTPWEFVRQNWKRKVEPKDTRNHKLAFHAEHPKLACHASVKCKTKRCRYF